MAPSASIDLVDLLEDAVTSNEQFETQEARSLGLSPQAPVTTWRRQCSEAEEAGRTEQRRPGIPSEDEAVHGE